VELTPHCWKKLWSKDIFYHEIVPPIIKHFEKAFGAKTRRQGDIFAYELPKELQDIKKLWTIMLIDEKTTNQCGLIHTDTRTNLFDTRHTLIGDTITSFKYPISRGIIKAPDHVDITLDNWHILSQTWGLYDPKKAD
jgi:hypothetical protein